MGQFVPMSPKDSSAAVRVYNPTSMSIGGVAFASHRPGSQIDLQSVLSIEPRENKATATNHVSMKLTLPVVREVDGVDAVVENIIVDLKLRIPFGSSDVERNDAIALLRSFLLNTDVPSLAPVLRGQEALW